MSVHSEIKKITSNVLMKMKQNGEKISMLTAYDFSIAQILDEAGTEILLVGDSAANVFCGHETTIPITLEQMIYHGEAVVRGTKRALVVVDLPFGSYQGDSLKALDSAIKIIKQTGCNAVKLEGGEEEIEGIKKIVAAGIPVMGHLGLTPQSINKFGTYSIRAKEEAEAQKLLNDMKLLEEAGCFAIVLEKIPHQLAKKASQSVSIPVIGIGAGADTDGQVLVINDLLGITKGFRPKFLRQYLNLNDQIGNAVKNYISDVKNLDFPNENERY